MYVCSCLRWVWRCFLCVKLIDKFLFSFFVHFVYISIFSLCSALFFFSFFSFFFIFFLPTVPTYLPRPSLFPTIIIIRKKKTHRCIHSTLLSRLSSTSCLLPSIKTPLPPLPPFPPSPTLFLPTPCLSPALPSSTPPLSLSPLPPPPPPPPPPLQLPQSSYYYRNPHLTHSFSHPHPYFPTYLPSNPPSIPSLTPSSHPSPRVPLKPPLFPFSLSDTEPSLLKEPDMSCKRYRWISFEFLGCWVCVCVILWGFS